MISLKNTLGNVAIRFGIFKKFFFLIDLYIFKPILGPSIFYGIF